jgi:hypothetical protein
MNHPRMSQSSTMVCAREARAWTAALASTTLLFLVGGAGCGGTLPPPTAANALPVAGIGPGALGIVKFDLAQVSEESLSRWLGFANRAELETGAALPRKLMLARDGLSQLGIQSGVVVIPALEAFPEELGVYLSGPSGIDREKIEDVFIKSGGLNLAGFSMASAFAKEVEPGWYFFGWGTDGYLDEADYSRAVELSQELSNAPTAPATLLLLADGSEMITPEMLPVGEGRTTRRLRALAEALKGMRSFMVSAGGERGVEWRVGFADPKSADAAQTAVTKALGDVMLMAEGSAAVGEIDQYDLLGWKRMAERAEITAQERAVAIRPAAR